MPILKGIAMAKLQLQYNVLFQPEPEGGFTVIVPSLPGCVTYGKSLLEAREMAIDAIRAYVASLKKHRELIPSDEKSFVGLVSVPKKRSPLYV